MRVSPPLVALGGVALLFAAGCRRAADPVPAAAPAPAVAIDACALLTLEEAHAIDRETDIRPVSSAVDTRAGTGDVKCTYGILEPVPRLVAIEVRRFPSSERARAAQREARVVADRLAHGKVEPVPRVGEEAFWGGGNLQQLHVRDGALRLLVTVELGPDRRGAAVAIAQRALRRLAGGLFTVAPSTGP